MDESKNSPVRFVLVTSTKNEWTLGHAIERVTNLGTMRLAALKDIQKLQEFSDTLDELNTDWQKVNPHLTTPQRTASGIQADLQKAINLIEGGVLDRISRSADWADLFGQIQTGLGMDAQSDKTVAEFQSYDDFARRRLGATFEFIKRLRIRYNNLHEAIKSHLDKVSAEDLSKLRRDSSEAVASINNGIGSLQQMVVALNKNASEQKSLLDVADKVLPIIIWYHLGAILHYLGFDKIFTFIGSDHTAASIEQHIIGGFYSFLAAFAITVILFRKKLFEWIKRLFAIFNGPKKSDQTSDDDGYAP